MGGFVNAVGWLGKKRQNIHKTRNANLKSFVIHVDGDADRAIIA